VKGNAVKASKFGKGKEKGFGNGGSEGGRGKEWGTRGEIKSGPHNTKGTKA